MIVAAVCGVADRSGPLLVDVGQRYRPRPASCSHASRRWASNRSGSPAGRVQTQSLARRSAGPARSRPRGTPARSPRSSAARRQQDAANPGGMLGSLLANPRIGSSSPPVADLALESSAKVNQSSRAARLRTSCPRGELVDLAGARRRRILEQGQQMPAIGLDRDVADSGARSCEAGRRRGSPVPRQDPRQQALLGQHGITSASRAATSGWAIRCAETRRPGRISVSSPARMRLTT